VVALAKKKNTDQVREVVEKEYQKRTGQVIQSFVMLPARGATVLENHTKKD